MRLLFGLIVLRLGIASNRVGFCFRLFVRLERCRWIRIALFVLWNCLFSSDASIARKRLLRLFRFLLGHRRRRPLRLEDFLVHDCRGESTSAFRIACYHRLGSFRSSVVLFVGSFHAHPDDNSRVKGEGRGQEANEKKNHWRNVLYPPPERFLLCG